MIKTLMSSMVLNPPDPPRICKFKKRYIGAAKSTKIKWIQLAIQVFKSKSATSCLNVTCPLKTLKTPYKIPEDARTNTTIPSTYPMIGTNSISTGLIISQINVLKNGLSKHLFGRL